MEKEKRKKILSYVKSLLFRTQVLSRDYGGWKVRPVVSRKIKKINLDDKVFKKILRITSDVELTDKKKKQLGFLVKKRIHLLKAHFQSLYDLIKKDSSHVWSRKVRSTEKELESTLTAYEEFIPLLFQRNESKRL